MADDLAQLGLWQRTLALVAQLQQGGLRATADPRSAHPPCAYVEPETLTRHSYCASDASWRVLLISGGGAHADALKALDPLLSAAMGVLEGAANARLVSWTSPQTGEQLAAWELTTHDLIRWEQS